MHPLLRQTSTFILSFSSIFFFSCNPENLSPEPEVQIVNKMLVDVNGESFEVINENISGNENCDKLYINTYYHDKDKIQFRVEFELSKTGQLLRVWYDEYTLPVLSGELARIYLTPNFNPTRTFEISQFYYNEETGEVRFKFQGTVFWEDNNSVTKELAGQIDINALPSMACSTIRSGISYFSEHFHLFSLTHNFIQSNDGTQRHRYFTNNGYILELHTDDDFWNIPLGTLDFDEKSHTNKITFQKQEGHIVANQLSHLDQYDWIDYQTSGQIIIEDKLIENNDKLITGKLNLTYRNEFGILTTLEGINFRTGSFE